MKPLGWEGRAGKRSHSYFARLPVRGKKNFRGPIPTGGYILSQCRVPLVLVDLAQGTCKSKVTQLHKTVCIQQDVRRLFMQKNKKIKGCQREINRHQGSPAKPRSGD